MGFPKDPTLKGLAAVCYRPEAVPWEHDIRAVLPESDEVPRVSDWHRRHGRAHNKARSIERAAAKHSAALKFELMRVAWHRSHGGHDEPPQSHGVGR